MHILLPLWRHILPTESLHKDLDSATCAQAKWHSNVYRMFVFRLVSGISFAVRSTAVFDNYIRLQFGDNTTVGLLSFSNSIALLLTASITGPLCDRYRHFRGFMLRCCGIFGIVCIGINYAGLKLDSLILLLLSSFSWSIWYEASMIVSDALFTDSLLPVQRSQAFVYRRIIGTIARGLGPILSLLLFTYFGNQWDLQVVHLVLQGGLALSFLQVIALLNWQDVYEPTESVDLTKKAKGKTVPKKSRFGLSVQAVPWIILASSKIKSVGAGLTVKYFALFFIKEYGFLPIHSSLLSTAYSISIAAVTYLIYLVSDRIGRVHVTFYSSVLATLFLFIFASSHYLPLVIVLYLLRGALQNAPSPLNKSVTMDIILSENRGKWASLESLSSVAWHGSALLGGLISDLKSYRYCFFVTGIFYIVGNLVYLPCLWLVEDYPHPSHQKKDSLENSSFTESEADFMDQPIVLESDAFEPVINRPLQRRSTFVDD